MSESLNSKHIGEQLKAARQSKNLTLDDVQKMTKIQLRYLEAIENDNFSRLPGDFYVRAFIRQYALAVDIHPEELLGDQAPASISRTSSLSRAHRDKDDIVRARNQHNSSAVGSLISHHIAKILWIILVLIALGVIWFMTTHMSGTTDNLDNNQVSVTTSSVDKKSSTTSSSSKKQQSSTNTSKSQSKLRLSKPQINTALQTTTYSIKNGADKTHRVKIVGQNGATAVKVNTDDSTILLDQTLTAGEEQNVTIPSSAKAFNVQFTNVANAKLTVDGKSVTISGNTTIFWNVLFNLKD